MYFTDTEKGKVYISSTNALIQQAVNLQLPDMLNWHSAAILMACDGDVVYPSPKTIGYQFMLIRNAVRKGDLELVSLDCGTFNQGIDKSKFKIWLNKTNRWECAQNTLLSNWWLDDNPVIPIESGPKIQRVENVSPDNDIALTHLLTAPQRQDDWFDVISDMTNTFYAQHGKVPNKSQAWAQLSINPPSGYEIKNGKDKGGENCLTMPGKKSLSQSGFNTRWEKYTKTKPNKPR